MFSTPPSAFAASIRPSSAVGAAVGVAVASGADVGVAVASGAEVGVAVAPGAEVGVAVALGAEVGVAVASSPPHAASKRPPKIVANSIRTQPRTLRLLMMYLSSEFLCDLVRISPIKLSGPRQRAVLDEGDDSSSHECRQRAS